MKDRIRRNWAVCSAAVFVLALVVSQCTFESPATPNWDVFLELPLISKHFVMADLADDIDELSVRDEQMVLSLEEQIESFEVGDRLRVDDFSTAVTVPAGGSLSDDVEIPNDLVVVDTAVVQQGMLTITFTNRGAGAVDAELILDDMTGPGGGVLQLTTTVPGGQSVFVQQNLAGFLIVPPIVNGANQLGFSVSLTGGEIVDVEIRIQNLVFSSISGVLTELEVPLEDVQADLDIPEEFEDLEIDTVDLRIAVDPGVEFPIIVDLQIQGTGTDDGIPRTITVLDTITPVPGEMSIIVVEGVADFFNAHPEVMAISGRLLIGDGVVSSRIDENHVVQAAVYLDMPLTVRLPGYALTTDTDTLGLDQDTRDVLNDNIISATLTADINNGLPIGASVRVVFAADSFDIETYTPDPAAGDVTFDIGFSAAPNDGGTPAEVNGTTPGSLVVELNEDNLDLFRENTKLYWAMEIDFPGTPQMIRFRPQDFIDITARLTAMVNTKVPEDEDGEGGVS